MPYNFLRERKQDIMNVLIVILLLQFSFENAGARSAVVVAVDHTGISIIRLCVVLLVVSSGTVICASVLPGVQGRCRPYHRRGCAP